MIDELVLTLLIYVDCKEREQLRENKNRALG